MVLLAGGEPVIVETREENGFAPDPDAHRARRSRRAPRAVIINSPQQPHRRGALAARRWRASPRRCAGHDCLIITDDIYEKLLYTGEPFLNIAQRGAGAGAAAGGRQRDVARRTR